LDEIDWESEVKAPLAEFDSVETDTPETVANWRRTTCEQGLVYLENQKDLIDRYRNDFIYMQSGEVVWSGPKAKWVSPMRKRNNWTNRDASSSQTYFPTRKLRFTEPIYSAWQRKRSRTGWRGIPRISAAVDN
jgi:hypothetical protein